MAIACAMVPHPMKPMVRPEAWSVEVDVEADMGKEVVVVVTGEDATSLLVLKVLILVVAVLIPIVVDLVVAAVVGVSNG